MLIADIFNAVSKPTNHLSSNKMCKPIVDLHGGAAINSLCSTARICIVMQIIVPKHTSCKHSLHTATFEPQLPQMAGVIHDVYALTGQVIITR